MATYPIKMLKDEKNQPFVPLVSTDCIRDENNQTLQQVLDKKLSPTNLLSGEYVSITTEGDNCYVNVDLPANLNIINNLTTSSAGQGALDAYQGKVLKDSIPQVVNDLSSTSTVNALSANQGYVLNNKFNNYLLLTGGTLTGHLYLGGISSSTTTSTTDLVFGTSSKVYGCIRANTGSSIVISNTLSDNTLSLEYNPSSKFFGPTTSQSFSSGTASNRWNGVYTTTVNSTGIVSAPYPQNTVYIGSQVIYSGTRGDSIIGKTNLIGAYDYTLIDGLFNNITIPSGWHKEYRLSFQGTTSNNTGITLFANNISTSSVCTWSATDFRTIGSTDFFKQSDITLETITGYSDQGINLKYQVTGVNSTWQFWDVTVHCYFVRD